MGGEQRESTGCQGRREQRPLCVCQPASGGKERGWDAQPSSSRQMALPVRKPLGNCSRHNLQLRSEHGACSWGKRSLSLPRLTGAHYTVAPNQVSHWNRAEQVGEGRGWGGSIETGAMQGAPPDIARGLRPSAGAPSENTGPLPHIPCPAASPTSIPCLNMTY